MDAQTFLSELPGLDQIPSKKRNICERCERPVSVCLCNVLPEELLDTVTRIIILQHPHETKQKLATVPILKKCLKHCHVIQGRSFRKGISTLLDSLMLNNVNKEDQTNVQCINPTPQNSEKMNQNNRAESPSEKLMSRKSYRLTKFPTVSGRTHVHDFDHEAFDGKYIECVSDVKNHPCSVDGKAFIKEKRYESNQKFTSFPNFEDKNPYKFLNSFDILVLFPTPNSCFLNDWLKNKVSNERNPDSSHINDASSTVLWPSVLLLVIDGTWNYAQEMVKASAPFFSSKVEFVCLPYDASKNGPNVGDTIMKKEPRLGFVSTMEAVAHALRILEPNGLVIEQNLIRVLKCMVDHQMQFMQLNEQM